jgi:two-component system, NarL family, sensor kinase
MADYAVPGNTRKRRWGTLSLRWRVVLTLFAAIGVALALGAAFVYQEAAERRHSVAHQALSAASAAANALDREVTATSYLARGLATSPALATGDYKGFYDQLVATSAPKGSWFVLWDRDRQVLNSRRPFGDALPTRADFGGGDESWNRIRTRGVSIGDRNFSPVTNTFVLTVSLRTNGADGEMNGFLSVVLPDARLREVVRETSLPPDWVTTIVDRRFAPIASNSDDPRFLAQELPGLLKARLSGPETNGHFIGHDGRQDALIAFHRSSNSDFTAFTSVPFSLANASVTEANRNIQIGGVILLLAGAVAGLALTRQVAPLDASAILAERRLKLAQARYESLWNDTPESLFVVTVTETGRFVFEGLNPAHERATGLTFEGIAGKEPEECLPPAAAAAVLARYRHCIATGRPEIYDEVLEMPSGRRHWQTSLSPVRDPDTDRICLLVGTARDVTDDREARAEVERSRSLLQATLDALSAHIAILDGTGTIIAVNQAWHRFAETGRYLTPDHGIGRNYLQVCRNAIPSDPQVPAIISGFIRILNGGNEVFKTGYQCGAHSFQMSVARFSCAGTAYIVVAHEDITDLRAAQQDAKETADRLLSLQDDERQRIAGDLHDSTAQHIVAAGLGLMNVSAAAGSTPAVEAALAAVRTSLNEADKEIRTLSYLLYPPDLNRHGLEATLRKFVEGFSNRTGLTGRATISQGVDQLPVEVQRSVLRVVQESLVNVHRHAKATKVGVDVKLDGTALQLRVSDNGKGLCPANVDAGTTPALGVGIPGMQSRIRQFGGTLDVESGAKGTTVEAVIPLAELENSGVLPSVSQGFT